MTRRGISSSIIQAVREHKGLVTVLDVRPPEEFAAGHVPGAINIPVHELEKRLKDLPRRKELVAYCRGPYCLMSYEAVSILRKKGLKARRLEARLPEWRAAGLPVAAAQKPISDRLNGTAEDGRAC